MTDWKIKQQPVAHETSFKCWNKLDCEYILWYWSLCWCIDCCFFPKKQKKQKTNLKTFVFNCLLTSCCFFACCSFEFFFFFFFLILERPKKKKRKKKKDRETSSQQNKDSMLHRRFNFFFFFLILLLSLSLLWFRFCFYTTDWQTLQRAAILFLLFLLQYLLLFLLRMLVCFIPFNNLFYFWFCQNKTDLCNY